MSRHTPRAKGLACGHLGQGTDMKTRLNMEREFFCAAPEIKVENPGATQEISK